MAKAKRLGVHRKRRERRALPGMMIHQDGSTHAWVPDQQWDLIVTLDDATSEHYSMFFVEQEGTISSLRGVREVIQEPRPIQLVLQRPGQSLLADPGSGRQG